MTVILALSERATSLPATEVFPVIDQECVTAVAKLFKFYNNPSVVTFAEFAEWYNLIGHVEIQWLELLDTQKWPGEESDDDSEAEQETALADAAGGPMVFETLLDADADLFIRFNREDLLRVRALLSAIDRSLFTPGVLTSVIEPDLSLEAVLDSLSSLVDFEGLSTSDRERVVTALTQLCNVFSDADGNFRLFEGICGLSIFFDGSKSEKLCEGFEIFADKDEDVTTPERLGQFLGSFLTALAALSSEMYGLGREVFFEVVDNVVAGAVTMVFTSPENDCEAVTFPQFAQWYNDTGHEFASWLELLNFNKWVGLFDDTQNQQSLVDAFSFACTLVPSDRSDGVECALRLTRDDFYQYQTVLQLSGLGNLSLEKLYTHFEDHEVGGMLAKVDFENCMQQLLPADMSKGNMHLVLSFFDTLYAAFAGPASEHVHFMQFVCGLSMFAQGNKSDKLIVAFSKLDDDSDGFLTQAEFSIFISCFLTSLMTTSGHCMMSYGDSLPQVVAAASAFATGRVFEESERVASGLISFEEFADVRVWVCSMYMCMHVSMRSRKEADGLPFFDTITSLYIICLVMSCCSSS